VRQSKKRIFLETHGKGKKISFPLGVNGRWEKNNLPCAIEKTHGKLKGLPCVPKKRTANYFLPCALYKTHGKEALCRAPERKRTAKIFMHGKLGFSRSEVYHFSLMM
jgi:hypothetical protein